MKRFLPLLMFTGCAGIMHAAVIQSISIDLSPLHPGSVLSGAVTLANPLVLGSSVQIPLTFSDPADYSPTNLTTTLSVTSGTPNDQFRFSPISFTNLANSKMYNLAVVGAASCAVDFPCQAIGGVQANSPPAFSTTYTVSASAATTVPEPGYGLLVCGVVTAFAVRRRLLRAR